jgi:hypothetical protein
LLKEAADDLYGRWSACEIGIMAMADPRKLIGRFGITERTVLPFGFKDAYFYDQIRYATGIMHAFTYDFIDDITVFSPNCFSMHVTEPEFGQFDAVRKQSRFLGTEVPRNDSVEDGKTKRARFLAPLILQFLRVSVVNEKGGRGRPPLRGQC